MFKEPVRAPYRQRFFSSMDYDEYVMHFGPPKPLLRYVPYNRGRQQTPNFSITSSLTLSPNSRLGQSRNRDCSRVSHQSVNSESSRRTPITTRPGLWVRWLSLRRNRNQLKGLIVVWGAKARIMLIWFLTYWIARTECKDILLLRQRKKIKLIQWQNYEGNCIVLICLVVMH